VPCGEAAPHSGPLQFDLTAMLDKALDVYQRVPVIAEDDEILD
jgi:hypothetical protein